MALIPAPAVAPARRRMKAIVPKAELIPMPLTRSRETTGLKRKNSTSNLEMAQIIPPSTRPHSEARESPLLSAVIMIQTFPILLMSQVTRNVPMQLTRRRHRFVSESMFMSHEDAEVLFC